jgi:hypothetical protein
MPIHVFLSQNYCLKVYMKLTGENRSFPRRQLHHERMAVTARNGLNNFFNAACRVIPR